MRTLILCFLTALALTVTPVSAGPGTGHSHAPAPPVTSEQALEIAAGVVANLTQKGKIDASWATVQPTEAIQKQFQHNLEWVVTFTNPQITEEEKKTLYVFLSLGGQYLAANFTGN